jgi:hypothetical protein
MNKASGKSVSCGGIYLACLNLLYELCHKIENMYFARITPPPHEPNAITLNSLYNPLVDQLEQFQREQI